MPYNVCCFCVLTGEYRKFPPGKDGTVDRFLPQTKGFEKMKNSFKRFVYAFEAQPKEGRK